METITLQVDGMHCGGCVNAIEHALRALDGVESVAVTLDAGTVIARYNALRVDPRALADAVSGAGYTVRDSTLVGPRPAPTAQCGGSGKGGKGCGCG